MGLARRKAHAVYIRHLEWPRTPARRFVIVKPMHAVPPAPTFPSSR